ncbi:cation:proton antiporter [Photobacterium sp.]|uniref:cation:proton antiporter n=1 Tax=Photobacterium sp. TaxID=660 RepID=UPI00299EA80D|nr:cation:proton antiporter [Photobacterium sp.]MDX1302060.1 cation:proton antiporter [Photobacterium sp.]
MHMDPAMPQVVGALLLILLTGLLLRLLHQPHVIAYLVAGVFVGPWGLALITDVEVINRLGAMGVVLLLFFVGMETDARKLIANWKLAIFGTLLQVGLSVTCVWLLGLWFAWPMPRIILIGFVISLSSTAVVIKLLQDSGILNSKVGQGVLGVLLAQDLAIIPMLIILGLLGAGEVDGYHLAKQGAGAIAAGLLFAYIIVRQQIHLPLSRWLKDDRELQLFTSLSICFGLALITAWFDLSTALGAFIAGMLINAAKETQWVHHTLESFRVLFIALFFVSIGMLLNLGFLLTNWLQVGVLVVMALLTNTFINAFILKVASFNWRDSLYAGVLLSQIGEFSFVLSAVGMQSGLISEYGYQLALCVISLSLLVSPIWINMGKRWLKWDNQ